MENIINIKETTEYFRKVRTQAFLTRKDNDEDIDLGKKFDEVSTLLKSTYLRPKNDLKKRSIKSTRSLVTARDHFSRSTRNMFKSNTFKIPIDMMKSGPVRKDSNRSHNIFMSSDLDDQSNKTDRTQEEILNDSEICNLNPDDPEGFHLETEKPSKVEIDGKKLSKVKIYDEEHLRNTRNISNRIKTLEPSILKSSFPSLRNNNIEGTAEEVNRSPNKSKSQIDESKKLQEIMMRRKSFIKEEPLTPIIEKKRIHSSQTQATATPETVPSEGSQREKKFNVDCKKSRSKFIEASGKTDQNVSHSIDEHDNNSKFGESSDDDDVEEENDDPHQFQQPKIIYGSEGENDEKVSCSNSSMVSIEGNLVELDSDIDVIFNDVRVEYDYDINEEILLTSADLQTKY